MSLAQVLAHEARLKKTPAATEGCDDESELHNQIIAECKRRVWIYFHGSMAYRAMRTLGEPDFIILGDKGRVWFIECKTKTGKLTPEQAGLQIWAQRLDHTIRTVRSFEEFLAVIEPSQ